MIREGPRSLHDGDVTLREVRREDAGDLYAWRMHPDSRFMFHATELIPFETHLRFLERYFETGNSDAWFVVEAGGRAVGSIVLYDLATDGSAAEWGRFVIAPSERGRGYGRRALTLLLEYARQRGIVQLRCDVLASNGSARELYRNLGFVETGSEIHAGREFVTMRLGPGAG
jgi:RimJ/RimL family protein N-acetyltransferase